MTAKKPVSTARLAQSMNASQRIYLILRQRIVDMILVPGTRVVEHDIAAELGTSRTPVHEAVQRLAEEGLIEVRPRVGTFVARIPLDGLKEMILVRTALEAAVIAKAVELATPEMLKKLRGILDEQDTFVKAGDRKKFHETDEAFHLGLTEAARYPGVWPIILQAKTQIDRYRQLTLEVPGRMQQVLVEHGAILAAVERRDVAGAEAAIRDHLAHILPGVEDAQHRHPDFFTGDFLES